ncbi:unnamed protein product [Linum trigynum]|uniref:Uncharacterized protein n=1 Tax=Linum trigynum TaxID=586398 RepID=A0AAV2EWD0_9ROSI
MRISCHVTFLENVMYYEASSENALPSLDFLVHLQPFDSPTARVNPPVPPPGGENGPLNVDDTNLHHSPPGTPSAAHGLMSSSPGSSLPSGSSTASLSSTTSTSSPGSSSVGSVAGQELTTPPPLPVPRRSNRSTMGNPPIRLLDYVGYSTDQAISIPTHYRFAKDDPRWNAAMTEEIDALNVSTCTAGYI